MILKFYKIKPNMDWQMSIDSEVQYDHFLLIHEEHAELLINKPYALLQGVNGDKMTPYRSYLVTAESYVGIIKEIISNSEVEEDLVEIEVDDDTTN